MTDISVLSYWNFDDDRLDDDDDNDDELSAGDYDEENYISNLLSLWRTVSVTSSFRGK